MMETEKEKMFNLFFSSGKKKFYESLITTCFNISQKILTSLPYIKWTAPILIMPQLFTHFKAHLLFRLSKHK